MDQTIPFKWGNFKLLLKDKIKGLAVIRCGKAIKDLQKTADPDYEPSSQGSQDS
jgi:hypothetical protein